jgi:hypothetical protein
MVILAEHCDRHRDAQLATDNDDQRLEKLKHCGCPRCAMRHERNAQHGIEADATGLKKKLLSGGNRLSQTQKRPAFIDAKYLTQPPA